MFHTHWFAFAALLVSLLFGGSTAVHAVTFSEGKPVKLMLDTTSAPILAQAYKMLQADMAQVLNAPLHLTDRMPSRRAPHIIAQMDASLPRQGFRITASQHRITVSGADAHGMAYGLLQLSRLMGVSPWEWWADATPRRLKAWELPSDTIIEESPAVPFRGIFLNDEDWGLLPWAHQSMGDPKGTIGPATCERIFQLLLRLRANTLWPAMHECTAPFFLTPGNREMAARYGIYIGSSHCEPLACNAVGEWKVRGNGDYDYVHNDSAVYRFWEQRVREVSKQEIIYTLGMRGVHDGQMQGAKTVAEQRDVLQRVLADQRRLIAQHTAQDITTVPQVFIPYKEVLDIYHAGLKVPEDVTLMWTDDNYGFIRHFPDSAERSRQGGHGLYYHVSYWGRPHDYLWLGTFSPGLLMHQLGEAWDRGIRQMWILNVGDIKPAEYQVELFMDMAWNPRLTRENGVRAHLQNFLAREFGQTESQRLTDAMLEYYQLCWVRRPEFLAGTRVEESDRQRWNQVVDMPWDEAYITHRLDCLQRIAHTVSTAHIADDRRNTYFQLVGYPVLSTQQMNRKFALAQLARHAAPADTAALWAQSDAAYDSIASLTRRYEAQPRWHGIMDMAPRRLTVFAPVPHRPAPEPMPRMDYKTLHPFTQFTGLGHSGTARTIAPGETVTMDMEQQTDTLRLDICLLPTHPVSGNRLRFAISVDGGAERIVDYHTEGRSEEWKLNVLRGQALRRIDTPVRGNRHTVALRALDQGVVLDELHLME